MNTVRNLGFNVSFDLWLSFDNENERNPGGRPRNYLSYEVEAYMNSITTASADRTINSKLDGQIETVNVRYRNVYLTEAYEGFELKDKISFTTFYNNVGPQFKKLFRFSDLFDYCELGRTLRNELKQELNELEYYISEEEELLS
jgi:hypothetical protein